MADQGPTRDELWARALKHAGIAEGEVARVDVDRMLDAKSQGRFMPPINAVAEQPRVVLATMPVAGDAPAALGLMRNHLEYARVFTKEPATYALTVDVAAALYQVYRDAGPGSAVVYNAIPMMSSANAVAAELVT